MTPPLPDQFRIDFSSNDPHAIQQAIRNTKVTYEQYGCFVAKGLCTDDLGAIERDIQRLIELRMEYAGYLPQPESDGLTRFDDGFVQLNELDRTHGSVIFDACRRLTPIHQASVQAKIVAIAHALMDTETLMCCEHKPVRIDQPSEDTYLFDWHQDFPFIMDSEDSIVYWTPLHDVDNDNGCLMVAPGSHRLGVMPVRVSDPQNRENNKSRTMHIEDLSPLAQYPQYTVPLNKGDVLVFNTLLLHRSQANKTTRSRWTLQIRYGNYEYEKAVKRDWPGTLRDGGWFGEKHPEYVLSNVKEFETVAGD